MRMCMGGMYAYVYGRNVCVCMCMGGMYAYVYGE